jgi:hypothetical protein
MYTTNVECAIVDIGTWCGSVTKNKINQILKTANSL